MSEPARSIIRLRYALDVQKQRGKDQFPVIPLSLNGTKLGVLEEFFVEEPIYIPVSSAAGGVYAALNAILVALSKRLPTDVPLEPPPKAEPLEELVLELTDLKFQEQDGVRRASARARLVYEPAAPGQEDVHSIKSWRFVAPIGPIEAEELRWYLEKYAIWPSEYFRDRAQKVEENLAKWGQLLHDAAMPVAHTANVTNAWARIDDHADRRFSIHVANPSFNHKSSHHFIVTRSPNHWCAISWARTDQIRCTLATDADFEWASKSTSR